MTSSNLPFALRYRFFWNRYSRVMLVGLLVGVVVGVFVALLIGGDRPWSLVPFALGSMFGGGTAGLALFGGFVAVLLRDRAINAAPMRRVWIGAAGASGTVFALWLLLAIFFGDLAVFLLILGIVITGITGIAAVGLLTWAEDRDVEVPELKDSTRKTP